MDPLNSIHNYKNLAKNTLDDLQAKKPQSKEDKKVIHVLKKEIGNLEAEQKRIESARKTDSAFIRALKFLGWVFSSPIWVLPWAIKKIFVTEQSPEERIQKIANKILQHIPKAKVLKEVLSQYKRSESSTPEAKQIARELIIGVSVDHTKTKVGKSGEYASIQSLKDLNRVGEIEIQGYNIVSDSERAYLNQLNKDREEIEIKQKRALSQEEKDELSTEKEEIDQKNNSFLLERSAKTLKKANDAFGPESALLFRFLLQSALVDISGGTHFKNQPEFQDKLGEATFLIINADKYDKSGKARTINQYSIWSDEKGLIHANYKWFGKTLLIDTSEPKDLSEILFNRELIISKEELKKLYEDEAFQDIHEIESKMGNLLEESGKLTREIIIRKDQGIDSKDLKNKQIGLDKERKNLEGQLKKLKNSEIVERLAPTLNVIDTYSRNYDIGEVTENEVTAFQKSPMAQ